MQRITVVSHNRPGLLAEVTELLASNGVSIASVVAQAHGSDGLIHIDLQAADQDRALEALTAGGYQAVSQDVLLARIQDRAGALAEIARRLGDAELDVRGLNMVQRDDGWAVIAIATSDNARAREVLGTQAV